MKKPYDGMILRCCQSHTEFLNTLSATRHGLTPPVVKTDPSTKRLIWQYWSEDTLTSYCQRYSERHHDVSQGVEALLKTLNTRVSFQTCYKPLTAAKDLIAKITKVDESFPATSLTAILSSLDRAYQPEHNVAIHGDLHAGNILIKEINGNLEMRLIDFSFSGMGDPLWDLASLKFDVFAHPEARSISPQRFSSNQSEKLDALFAYCGWLSWLWFHAYGFKDHAHRCQHALVQIRSSWQSIFSAALSL